MAIVVNRFRKREGVKKFFAFVDVSDHLKAIKKHVVIYINFILFWRFPQSF